MLHKTHAYLLPALPRNDKENDSDDWLVSNVDTTKQPFARSQNLSRSLNVFSPEVSKLKARTQPEKTAPSLEVESPVVSLATPSPVKETPQDRRIFRARRKLKGPPKSTPSQAIPTTPVPPTPPLVDEKTLSTTHPIGHYNQVGLNESYN